MKTRLYVRAALAMTTFASLVMVVGASRRAW